jgi:hypothetical protein
MIRSAVTHLVHLHLDDKLELQTPMKEGDGESQSRRVA